MGLLLLLTSMLLSSYFHPGIAVDATQLFTIRKIILSIEPSADVARDTNVSVRCKAIVSSSGQEVLRREYTIYKDNNKVYTTNSSTSEDLVYPLPGARVSDNGRYECKINIKGKEMTSSAQKLTVTGLSKPVLNLNNGVVSEEEEVTATCTAPGETGHFFFQFYEDSKPIHRKRVNSNQYQATFRLSSVGIHKMHCDYMVFIIPDTFSSEESNKVTVSVKELSITPVLEIFPQTKIFEGDRLNILCTIRSSLYSNKSTLLYLSHGSKLLSTGDTKVNYSMNARAEDPEDFECKLETGNVAKAATKIVSVTELFSAPTLTMSPAEVFQREIMTLTCKSERYASERLKREELTYIIEPPNSPLTPNPMNPGVFHGKALWNDFNYTCVARAKGIMKHSETLTVRPKVSVSVPRISVEGRAILGRPFKIRCQSETGSFPINYTLLKDYNQLNTTTVKLPSEQALFTVTITKPEEISTYMCEAKNNHKEAPLSKRLSATVIEPLTDTTLTVIPHLPEISEGDSLYLICGAKGTPPVTFSWYRDGNKQPLHTTTSDKNNTNYIVPRLSKEHSGKYYCEAHNHANNIVRSENVTIEVQLALWKKAVIGGVCLLVALVLVVVCMLYFKSKRGAASLYDGMEGRVTNGTRDSVESLPADISNRSSYSIPATV